VTVIGKRSAAVGLAVLAVAGCGGTAGKRSGPMLSRNEFLARVNRVCRKASTHTDRLAGLGGIRSPAAIKDLYGHWLAAERDALAAAKELEHPAEESEGDPIVRLTIAEGKIAGYARRLGAHACDQPQAGTMQP
jgi:hypothetical protein